MTMRLVPPRGVAPRADLAPGSDTCAARSPIHRQQAPQAARANSDGSPAIRIRDGTPGLARRGRDSVRAIGVDHRRLGTGGHVRGAAGEGVRGARHGVCRTPKVDLVRSIGADHVIDYTATTSRTGRSATTRSATRPGASSLSHLRRALTPRGTSGSAGRGEETTGRKADQAPRRRPNRLAARR